MSRSPLQAPPPPHEPSSPHCPLAAPETGDQAPGRRGYRPGTFSGSERDAYDAAPGCRTPSGAPAAEKYCGAQHVTGPSEAVGPLGTSEVPLALRLSLALRLALGAENEDRTLACHSC